MLPETEGKQVIEVAERLCQAVAAAEVPLENGQALRFTTSIGVANSLAGDSSFAQMLDRADKALYEAKNTGRNKVCASQCDG